MLSSSPEVRHTPLQILLNSSLTHIIFHFPEGPVEESKLPTHRLALSVPIVIAHIDPRSTAPIFASHPYDLQHFPPASESEVAHVGPPGGNVEIKLVGKEEVDVDETTRDPRGQVCSVAFF